MLELDKIYKGDCLEVMELIDDKSVDMILADLPYGISDCVWDNKLDLAGLWAHYNRIIKDGGVVVLTAVMKFAVDLINSNRRDFRYDLIWRKSMPTGFPNSHKMPLRSHEHILVFYKRLPTYNPQGLVELEKPIRRYTKFHGRTVNSVYDCKALCKPYLQWLTNYPCSVLEFSNGNYSTQHPTQKPVELFRYLVRTYTNEGEVVLDNCIGSGTTALACIATKRHFIGIEKDDKFFEMACERVRKLTDSQNTLL